LEDRLKTQFVKDIPIGTLLIVISLFCIYATSKLANNPPFLSLVGIFFLCFITNKLIAVGIDLIAGLEIPVKNDQE
jgi:hypothetical protein